MLYWQTTKVYPNAGPDFHLAVTDATLTKMGSEIVRKLKPYKEYTAWFLPPTVKDIPEAQNLNNTEYNRLKQDYISLNIHVFRTISELYGLPYSLKLIEQIAPALMEALRYHNNKQQIQDYLNYEFRSESFKQILDGGICQTGSGDNGLAAFFSMYSPYDEQGHPLPGTKGNLGLIAKWFAEGDLRRYIDTVKETNHYVYSMAFLPHIFDKLSSQQKHVFNDLLFNLNKKSSSYNGLLIASLYNKTGYFDWLEKSHDAFDTVIHNNDVHLGKSAPKYKYVFITSYPTDNSGSILNSFDGEQISNSALNHLLNMDIAELSEHNFTSSEKNWALAENVIDTADWAITAASIASIPFTAGASASVTFMMLARKGAIAAAKKTMKTLGRRTLKSTLRLAGKYGRKAAMRELKKTAGGIYKAYEVYDLVDSTLDLASKNGKDKPKAMALAHFLANSADAVEQKDLCDEINKLKGGN